MSLRLIIINEFQIYITLNDLTIETSKDSRGIIVIITMLAFEIYSIYNKK